MRKIKRILFFVVCFIILCLLVLFFYKRYSSNKEVISLTEVLPGKQLQENQTYIFIDDKYLDEDRGLIHEHNPYLPMEMAAEYDSRFYFQEGTNELLFTNSKEVIRFKEGDSMTIKDNKGQEINTIPFVIVNGKQYISVDFMNSYSGGNIKFEKDPDRIIIFSRGTEFKSVNNNEYIRNLTGHKSYVLQQTNNTKVKVLSENIVDGWSKVVSKEGYVGYIENSNIGSAIQENDGIDDSYRYFTLGEKVKLGWHQVGGQEGNITGMNLAALNHINVISPTWFSIIDNNGSISNFSSTEYVEQMHSKNIKVWILVDDFNKDINLTDIFKNEASRKALINNLVTSTKAVGADGINIDFEHITKENAYSYIQFLRELYLVTRSQNLIISTDNYVPMEYNKHYFRDQQNQVIDYFIIMGYDEHTGGSESAGSVSSYNFVKKGIENTLKDVPKEKVINGIPFYTRLWKEEPTTTAGSNTLTSEILSLKGQDKVLSDLGADVKWDEDAKQNYMEIIKAGVTYKMWLEDEKSLNEKLQLVRDNDLAGFAIWKLSLEPDDLWGKLNYE